MHSYIFPRLFTALFKLGLRFIFSFKRNCCVVESVYCSCDHKDDVDNDDCDWMRMKMWCICLRCDWFSFIRAILFCGAMSWWFCELREFRSFVQIGCVCFTCISSFPLEVMSSAFVLHLAAILIVEAFVFVFCLRHETRRCVVYWFSFWSAAVSLRCFYWAVFERRALSFSSQVMCFDLERAVPAFVLNVGGCFDTWNALLFHH